MFLALSALVRKNRGTMAITISAIAAICQYEIATAQEVFRSGDVVMGYASATAPANVQGYPNCFTSIGDSMWIRSDNSANQTPSYSVSVANGQVSVSQNKHVSARAAYVCLKKSSTVVGAHIKAGYVNSGASIGSNLSCVLSVANFTRVRPPSGNLTPGTVTCAYDSATGKITASQTGQGRISECGYVCVNPSSAASSSLSAYRYPSTFSGTDALGTNLSCARGTTNFSTGCSGVGVTEASYSSSTGLATKGFANGCTRGSFSYLCASASVPQCSDNRDNDSDGLIDLRDPGCSSASDNDESNTVSGQCNDGIDNDKDGKVDALLNVAPALDRSQTFGGAGDPMQVTTLVSNAIAAKKLPFTRPTAPLVRTDNGSWDSGTPHLPTLNQVCRILGYRTYVSSTCRDGERSGRYPNGKCNFHSPGDNQHFRFNGTNFAVESANPKYGKTWIATITCAGALSACSDGVDNDGDGKVDLADDGCASASDTDERPHDPQCTSPSSPSEFAQCNDSKDNDNDGVTDRADPGCWTDATNPNTYDANRDNEAAATTQCQDDKDNDGDTLVDAKDPGCFSNPKDPATYDRTRNNEALSGPGECMDGKDNDNDGVADKNDPGCWTNPLDPNTYNPYGGPESSATTQCQDGKDNDGDTLVDAKDPGCFSNPKDPATYDRTRNNEALVGPGECQDGKDNDNDGVADKNDPGCWTNPLDPNTYNPYGGPESSATTQCQDGKDNDGDTLVDAKDPGCFSNPKDPKTYDRTRNNEALSGPGECQDGKDNDNDGVADKNDPGCWTNPLDPNTYNPYGGPESSATTQCQDGKDNDSDTLVDAKDPGCFSNPLDPATYDRTRNDESVAGASECKDGKDNDNDGLIDAKDPGCWKDPNDPNSYNPLGGPESSATTQCQDTKDNDADGLIDLKDPGCADAQDNDEADEKALLTVGVECITVNNDGKKTAYFSYNNTTGAEVTVTTNASQGTLNEFATTGVTTPPPTLFKAGLSKGSVVVPFTGDSLTWLVRAPKSSASRATASAATPVCAPVVPKAECRGYQNGVLTAQVGYVNGNSFEQQIPIGPSNGFTPGSVDRGQPNRFFAGTNKSVFQVALASTTDSLTWVVNGSSVKIDNTLPVCDGECVDTPTGNVTAQLDAIAQQLSDVMTRAANILASAKATNGKNVSAATKRNRTDAERAKKKADDYSALAKTLTIQFPQVIKTCPQAPAYCETVDRQYAIESLKGLYANQRNSTQRTIARSYFRNTGKTSRTDSLVKQAKDLEKQGLAALAQLPRFETQCK